MAALIDAGVPAAQAAEAIHAGTATEPIRVESPEPDANPLIRDIISATTQFDSDAIRAGIARAVTDLGWGQAMEEVLFPAMIEVGRGWESGALSVANEHVLTELVRLEMFSVIAAQPPPAAERPLVILACPEAEYHDLGLIGLWLLLGGEGVPVRFLGANVPQEPLIEMVRLLSPRVVCLGATVQPALPGMAQAARALLRIRPAPHVFVGGPAVHEPFAPLALGGARLPIRIREAASVVLAALEDDE